MSVEVQCIMSMEVTSLSPKICSVYIFFPMIESMPSAPAMGKAKREDDYGVTTIRPGIFTGKKRRVV